MSPELLAELERQYEEWAQEYLESLPLEHFKESTAQATQREITLESLALVRAQRPDVHVFNELLVQYPRADQERPGQVVPDNMVVVHDGPLEANGSYNLPYHPPPLWVLEYVSRSSQRKDHEDNLRHHEQALRVPYYLIFAPHEQEILLYRHDGSRYRTVAPDERGRYRIPELDLEVALQDHWVRFWYQGELLPLPAELLRQAQTLQKQLDEARQQLQAETQRAEEEAQRAEAEAQRAKVERQRAEEEAQRAEAERQAREAAEAEVARLRAELQRLGGAGGP